MTNTEALTLSSGDLIRLLEDNSIIRVDKVKIVELRTWGQTIVICPVESVGYLFPEEVELVYRH